MFPGGGTSVTVTFFSVLIHLEEGQCTERIPCLELSLSPKRTPQASEVGQAALLPVPGWATRGRRCRGQGAVTACVNLISQFSFFQQQIRLLISQLVSNLWGVIYSAPPVSRSVEGLGSMLLLQQTYNWIKAQGSETIWPQQAELRIAGSSNFFASKEGGTKKYSKSHGKKIIYSVFYQSL